MALVKKKDGWEAEDQFDFMGPRRLSIRTYKMSGKLITCASVNKYRDGGYEHAYGLSGGGDYDKYAFIKSDVRATEKSVAAQHAEALTWLPMLFLEAKAHYEKFPPRD